MPARSAARARPSTLTPQPPSADSRPSRAWPVSVTASATVRGWAGEAAGSTVMLTRVATSAAAAGALATSWSMISSAGRGAAGSIAAATWPVSVDPGSGAVSTVTVTQRSDGR